tara:strand:- start:4760 stop:5641 length:882 start_codon:yes stop_codon:yes gene_type:complete
MEKTTLFVFYNLFMMSIYMGVNVLKPFVLYTLSIVYISIVFFINFNLQDVWETETSSRSEKMALLTWQYLWGIVICMFIFKDLEWINDLGIISAFILFLVLTFTTITSCYVILMDSRHWTTQMFMTASLHWILFHINQNWISSALYVLTLPLFVILIIRIVYYIETNENPKYAILEGIVFIILIGFEIAYDTNIILLKTFFIIASIGFFIIIITQHDKFTNLLIFSAPISIPLIYINICVNVYCFGWKNGLKTSWKKITTMYRNWTGEEIKLLQVLSKEGVLTFNENQFDNTL